MKKFYTTLLAVATLALSASATNLSLPSTMKVKKAAPQVIENATITEAPMVAVKAVKKDGPVRKITSTQDLAGNYAMYYLYYNSKATSQQDMWLYYATDLVIEAKSSTEVTLTNFWDKGIVVTGTVDVAEGFVSIPKQVIAKTTDFGIISIPETDVYTSTLNIGAGGEIEEAEDPIELDITEDGVLGMEGYWGIACTAGFLDVCYSVECNRVNSILTMADLDLDTMTPTEISGYVNVKLNGNVLSLYNFYGLGFTTPINFVIDKESKTATATDQLVGEGDAYDFYFATTLDGQNVVKTVVADITGDNNNVLEFGLGDDLVGIVGFNKNATTIAGWYMIGYDMILTTPFNLLDNNGVEGIVVDNDNSAAAVEYFNLQGVKVNNPVAGGLYIRRQGTDVQKVIVR